MTRAAPAHRGRRTGADPLHGHHPASRRPLTFQGLTTTAATKHIAITGGTGRYQGAGGEATLVELGDGTGTLIIRLRR